MNTTTDINMDESTHSSARVSEDMESVKQSFSQLRTDVMDLLSNAFGLGKSGAEFAKDGAESAVETLKTKLSDMKHKGAEGMESVEKKIGDNPLPAALIAFGVGFLVAKILTRR